jgi:hypothetical protein
MNTRVFAAAALLGLAVPFALTFAVPALRTAPASLDLSALNWLYMAAPHLIVILVALVSPRTRSAAVAALLSLTVLLLSFQAWVWWQVPARESGLAWLLYFPLALAAVLLALVVWFGVRREREAAP